MVVVVASYYRLGLINIALRYTRFLNTLKYMYAARGSLFLLSLFLSLCLRLSIFSSLSIFVSLRFRNCSRSFRPLSSLSLSSDARDQFANHFLLRNPASTRSALDLLALFCSSASALLVLFCFFRFVQSSSPARESLAATRLPLEAAIQNKKIHFCVIRCHAQRTYSTSTRLIFQRQATVSHIFPRNREKFAKC